VTLRDLEPRLLMNSPPLVLGPVVRDNKAYAEIAHTAQSVAAFVAIDNALKQGGVSVPEIFAADLSRGFLLIEHLGSGSFLDGEGRPVAERYAAAARLLAAMHRRSWPRRLEAAPGINHDVPPFDRDALLIEAELLIDWYFPYVSGRPADEAVRNGFRQAWNRLLDRIEGGEETLVLRDLHSPNIIWREGRQGHARLGIIDFQDALIGSPAYDLASLAMDARVDMLPDIERATVDAYVAARHAAGPFDEAILRQSYAIMAAQRNSKILGIFVRLDKRDGKPAYLRHLPRIRNYLARALAHPALGELRDLYRQTGLIGEDPA
jgi:aminoglycoside/choline kinase family phosphotransferase